ncbi:hypothetical protein J8M20_15155 [Pseudoalteromonas luteoviolacea]|uniref:Tn7-like element transposition protein TnsE n=1 Tax=Pseudoalteromonas luteoviolacea TaxID=43657 RepID=UPI001B35995B|nr:Tn7-like element transposition protein TnsE [Pseudoalteromonas luteoviolacea]MBQ4812696.1 hypothetical protein [Pseudoalteromonas luteoviolacea]
MSRKIGHTEAQYRKWIKEGRGSGEYQDYKPWLTVYDSPSDGKASLATKVLSASALSAKGNLSEFIPEIESRLMEGQISWPTKYFDRLTGAKLNTSLTHQRSDSSKGLNQDELRKWAERLILRVAKYTVI